MKQTKEIFQIINDYFDHIYVITLKKSEARHPRIHNILNTMNYELFWGVDGSKLDLARLARNGAYDPTFAKKNSQIGRELVFGEIGCAMSHIEVYRDILDKGYKRSLVLEDDVAVESASPSVLRSSLSEMPADWDLLYLGYKDHNLKASWAISARILVAYPILYSLGFNKFDARRLRCQYPRTHSKHLDLAGYHYGTHAYAVSQSGAERLLERQTPLALAADDAIGHMCMEGSLNAFLTKHRFFSQDEQLGSTIEGRRRTRG